MRAARHVHIESEAGSRVIRGGNAIRRRSAPQQRARIRGRCGPGPETRSAYGNPRIARRTIGIGGDDIAVRSVVSFPVALRCAVNSLETGGGLETILRCDTDSKAVEGAGGNSQRIVH